MRLPLYLLTYLIAGICAAMAAAPANDSFAASDLPEFTLDETAPMPVSGSNVDATMEAGEPASDGQAHSVWWSWTPQTSGFYALDTLQSPTPNFDTILAVYTGSSVNALTKITLNDQYGGNLSHVIVEATAGTTYRIAVSGWGESQGSIELNLTSVTLPNNNDLAHAILLVGSVTGSNQNATLQDDEPNYGGASVWWKWTAPESGAFRIDVVCGFTPTIAVCTGDSFPLNPVKDNFLDISPHELTFDATVGIEYKIAIQTASGFPGPFDLQIYSASPPANDNFLNAATLENLPTGTKANGTNRFATREDPGEPNPTGSAGASVWWTWTAPQTAEYKVDTSGSEFATVLCIYQGDDFPSLVPQLDKITSSEYSTSSPPNTPASITFSATKGTTYRIAVWGQISDTGTVALNVSATAPANDSVLSATDLGYATAVNTSVELGGADLDTGEPNSQGAATRSAWWIWTAPPQGGLVTIDTQGSDIDTILDVFQDPSGPDPVWSNRILTNDNCTDQVTWSQVTFLATADQTYHLRVTDNTLGIPSSLGGVSLNLTTVSHYCVGYGLSEEQSEDSDDPDHDSYTNLEEYLFGLDPSKPDAPRVTTGTMTHDASSTYINVTFTRRIDMGATLLLMVSDNLITWTQAQAVQVGNATLNLDGFTETVTYQITTPLAQRKFVHLQTTIPEPH